MDTLASIWDNAGHLYQCLWYRAWKLLKAFSLGTCQKLARGRGWKTGEGHRFWALYEKKWTTREGSQEIKPLWFQRDVLMYVIWQEYKPRMKIMAYKIFTVITRQAIESINVTTQLKNSSCFVISKHRLPNISEKLISASPSPLLPSSSPTSSS